MAAADVDEHIVECENDYSFNVIELAFAVGHIKETKNGNEVKYSQDGYISALLLFIILLSFGIALSGGRWITAEQPFPVHAAVVEGGLSIYMLIGFCFMILMMCRSTQKKFGTKEPETNMQNKYQMLIEILPLISLKVFLLGVITTDFLTIFSYSLCIPEYQHLNNFPSVETDTAHEAVVRVLYHIVRCTFCTLMSVFCCFCVRNNVVFYRKWYLRFGITVLLSSLLWIWFKSQLTESKDIFHHTEENPFCQNVTANDVHINSTVLCACKKTTSFET